MRYKLLAVASAVFLMAAPALAQNAGTVTNHAFAIGKGAGVTGYSSALCTSAQLIVGQSAADPLCKTITGDVTITSAGVTAIGATKVTSADLNADVFSTAHSWAGQQTFTAPILGTPASGTLTNTTGLPVSSGISGLGTGVATFLTTPSSANLRAALTDEVGTGAAYFVGGALGTPASATLTNASGLPLGGLATQGAFSFVGNNTSGSASPTAVSIASLTSKASPVAGDLVMIADSAASNAWKQTTVSALASAGSVASIAGNTGAFTLSGLLTNSTNVLQVTAAAKTDQQAGTSNVLAVTPLHQQDHPSAAKAWARCNNSAGTYTLADSYNINGGTCGKTATGAFTLTFATAFANANYACHIQTIGDRDRTAAVVLPSTGTVTLQTFTTSTSTLFDVSWSVVCFGTQ